MSKSLKSYTSAPEYKAVKSKNGIRNNPEPDLTDNHSSGNDSPLVHSTYRNRSKVANKSYGQVKQETTKPKTQKSEIRDSADNPGSGNDSLDVKSIDSSCFIDNASVDTILTDNNLIQDGSSVDNYSINASMDMREDSESTLDLQEITQGILDLEETQASRNNSEYGTSIELQGKTQVPSSPPPSYEHVLAETRLAQQAALTEGTDEDKANKPATTAEVQPPPEPKKGIEIMHKTHKEFYRAVAKQWGITCKMSDHCRCLDCQSMYFDCEYDYNEQEKTDGGLGAGTPMFISEVMHGSACTLL